MSSPREASISTVDPALDAVIVGETTLRPLGRIVGAVAFGWALVLIYYSKSELLTSNMMVVTIGAYYRRRSWNKVVRLLGLCYLGNVLGGLFFASSSASAPYGRCRAGGDDRRRGAQAGLHHRRRLGMVGSSRPRHPLQLHDQHGDAAGLQRPEHSVANTVLFTVVGLREGIDAGPAAANVGIALVGSFIGGGLLIGLYYAYVNDDAQYLRSRGQGRP